MIVGETYRVFSSYNPASFADIKIVKINEDKSTIQRLKDGEIVEIETKWLKRMPKKRMVEIREM